MTECQPMDTPIPTPCQSDATGNVMGAELSKRYQALRRQFEAEHRPLFPGQTAERNMERGDWCKLNNERNRLWAAALGLEVPPVPSALDATRDASCLTCRDQGWVHPGGYANGVRPCRHCNPQDEARAKAQMAYSGIPDTQKVATFESFRPMPGTEKALKAARELVFGGECYMVLLVGTYGNGKTHLAYAACREAMKMGMRARFVYWPDLLAEHRRRMDARSGSQDYIDEIKRCQFLAIDEIGFTSTTEFQAGLLEEIVSYRYNHVLHTIMTTNRDVTQLPGAIVSRFRDADIARIVLNRGGDYRPKKVAA
jgi:DNA replication protein DnaC